MNPRRILLLCTAILIVVSSNLNWGDKNWRGIIEADAKGYYAYLPAIFIYSDLNYHFFEEMEEDKYYDANLYSDYRSSYGGRKYNKHFVGTAVAEIPFFLVAHGLTYILGKDADGYSKLYPIFINLAGVFYAWLGLYYLLQILSLYGIRERYQSWTIVATLFGTNLFYYAVVEPGMSHVYSFAFVAMFFYFAKKYFTESHVRYLIYLSFALGMIILIRPVNGLVVLSLPFIAGDFETLKSGFLRFLKTYKVLVLSALIFFLMIVMQLIVYKLSTGQYYIYAYANEGFDFSKPHFFDILFSYRKGLFLYTPMYLIALVGTYYFFRKSRFSFVAFYLFLAVITYVFSSWWMWYYGGSFSSRVYVEFLPFFMLALGICLQNLKVKWKRVTYMTGIGLLIVLCQLQTYQYRYFQIHWSDMNQEKYWDVFLRLDKL